LKHMKTQYGNHVLRILYLTQDVNRLWIILKYSPENTKLPQ
jgi:hypothetical protein